MSDSGSYSQSGGEPQSYSSYGNQGSQGYGQTAQSYSGYGQATDSSYGQNYSSYSQSYGDSYDQQSGFDQHQGSYDEQSNYDQQHDSYNQNQQSYHSQRENYSHHTQDDRRDVSRRYFHKVSLPFMSLLPYSCPPHK
uniref:TATA-box binding protein associated factor 15 n=1 Tax=Saimiri boliviensis boliviensis TaxID=39432 RepID=A0A2K6SE96_SAIBB